MNLFLQELVGENSVKESLVFPMSPDKISTGKGIKEQSYEIMGIGDISKPYGNTLDEISFEVIVWGEGRKDWVESLWRDPKEIDQLLTTWKETGTIIRVMVTETNINMDAFITQYDADNLNSYKDMNMKLSIKRYKELTVTTVDATKTTKSNRTVQTTPKTYTVKEGDSLWAISKKIYGDGSRYNEIFAKNSGTNGILTNPSVIAPGQVLKV